MTTQLLWLAVGLALLVTGGELFCLGCRARRGISANAARGNRFNPGEPGN